MIDTEFDAVCQSYVYPLPELMLALMERHSGKSSTNVRTAITQSHLSAFFK